MNLELFMNAIWKPVEKKMLIIMEDEQRYRRERAKMEFYYVYRNKAIK